MQVIEIGTPGPPSVLRLAVLSCYARLSQPLVRVAMCGPRGPANWD